MGDWRISIVRLNLCRADESHLLTSSHFACEVATRLLAGRLSKEYVDTIGDCMALYGMVWYGMVEGKGRAEKERESNKTYLWRNGFIVWRKRGDWGINQAEEDERKV